MKELDHDIRILLNQATVLHRQGDREAARIIYKNVIEKDPNEPNAWHLLGVASWQDKDLESAEEYIRKAIGLHNSAALYYSNLGGILRQKGDLKDSISQYEKAHLLDPYSESVKKELSQTLHRHALALTEERKWVEVKTAYNRVLELEPDNIPTLNNLAAVIQYLDSRAEAITYYNKALAVDPKNLLVLYNRSICYLTDQRLEEGWVDFAEGKQHWRRLQDNREHLPWTNIPLWNKEDLIGKEILIWGNQGIGDEIIYASMVPEIIERKAIITIECHPRLVSLFERSFPETRVLPRQNPPLPDAHYDYQAPGMWLACQLRNNKDAFSKSASFLKADSDLTKILRQRYRAFGKKYIVGLSWFTVSPVWGKARSIPLPDMLKTLPLKDMLIIDMQYGKTEQAWHEARQVFPELTIFHDTDIDQFQDMDSFASQVAACDVIYTISNTTSHVAGALGVPSVVLMSDIGLTWYWFSEGSHCPWYPSLYLLRPSETNRYEKAAELLQKMAFNQAA